MFFEDFFSKNKKTQKNFLSSPVRSMYTKFEGCSWLGVSWTICGKYPAAAASQTGAKSEQPQLFLVGVSC